MNASRPWFWEQRNAWFCEPQGKRVCLGPHPEGYPAPKKGKRGWNVPQPILDAFQKVTNQTAQAFTSDAVCNVLDDFLSWCKQNRAARTEERYRDFIQDFINFQGIGRMAAAELDAGHVTRWLDAHPNWKNTTRHNAITALQRGFNWACKNRGLNKAGGNPIKGMEKPQRERFLERVREVSSS